MNSQRKNAILLSLSLLIVIFIQPGVEAKKNSTGSLTDRYQVLLQMPEGAERTAGLQALLVEDIKGKIGPGIAEELTRIYWANGELDKAVGIMDDLQKRKSNDYKLKVDVAIAVYDKRQDVETAVLWLKSAIKNVAEARQRKPGNVYAVAWANGTSRIIAEIEHQMADIYLKSGEIKLAKDHISKAIAVRTDPKDYHIFSEILLHQGLFRECMGSAMFSIQHSGIKDARETFKSAYDSLEWDLRLYEEYFRKFRNLYVKENAKQVLDKMELTVARDLPDLNVSSLIGANGAVLIFWNESIEEYDFDALNKLNQFMKKEGVPHVFLYNGTDYNKAVARMNELGYDFAGTDIANLQIQKVYKVVSTPTVLVVGSSLRLLYRMEGPNKSLPEVFTLVWESHISSRKSGVSNGG